MKIAALVSLASVSLIFTTVEIGGAIIPAASVASSDLAKAIAAAKNGDTITVPAGVATWTSPVSCYKAVTFSGAGTDSTIINGAMATGGGDPSTMTCLMFFPGGATNLARVTGISFVGTGGGCGLLTGGKNLRVDHCAFSGFSFGNYFYGFGCVDHCTFSNNLVAVRSYGDGTGAPNWQNQYPIAFDSLNYLIVEDCNFAWANNYAFAGRGHAICSSGQGSSYVVRYCTVTASIDGFEPAFDWHGDNNDGTHGNLSSQVYGNSFILSGTASMDKFVDARGGQGLVYSNSVVGAPPTVRGVAMREEWPGMMLNDPDPMDLVTNMWIWSNTVNGAPMPSFVDDSTGLIKLGVQYFTNAPTPYLHPPYPHPLISQTSISQVKPPSPSNFRVVAGGG